MHILIDYSLVVYILNYNAHYDRPTLTIKYAKLSTSILSPRGGGYPKSIAVNLGTNETEEVAITVSSFQPTADSENRVGARRS